MITITRDLQIALARYTAGITRASREYAQHPHSGVDWCVKCVHPVASNPDCIRCRESRNERIRRAHRIEEVRNARR